MLFDLEEPVSLASVDQRGERIGAVARTTDEILSRLGDGFELSHRFELVSAMAGLIDRAALQRLDCQHAINYLLFSDRFQGAQ